MPREPAGHGQQLHHLELRRGIVGEPVLGQQLERQRLQRVAHQQRGRLVEFDVQVGLPRRSTSSSMHGRSSCTSE